MPKLKFLSLLLTLLATLTPTSAQEIYLTPTLGEITDSSAGTERAVVTADGSLSASTPRLANSSPASQSASQQAFSFPPQS